ncbi:translation repressor protein [Salmonella phage CRW-SP2]|nr:translation repressor protein [Salmonella phage CRW-SP2]
MARNTLDILGVSAVDDENKIIECLAEVRLNQDKPGIFLSIKETLSRIGVSTRYEPNTLHQTCHILYKGGKYYIVHFKHMYMLDGHYNGFKKEDILRMNRIIKLLVQWNMISLVDPAQVTEAADMSHIKIVKHEQVSEWKLVPKYEIRPTRQPRK